MKRRSGARRYGSMRASDPEALAALRASRGSLPDIAHRAGVSVSTLSRAERGSKIQKQNAGAIARVLASSLEKLFICDATITVPKLVPTARTPVLSPELRAVAHLHELPPPDADFAGRVQYLEDVLEAEKRKTKTIMLNGPPGVGKTALALKIAEELSYEYPEAQCYFDLKGMSAQPLSASDAMRHVILSLRPDVTPPAIETEVGGLYRSVLHGKRAILLIDNARDATQVAPLLPPPTCLLLVTSRVRFTLPGSLCKDIAVFSAAEARDLLLAITPRIQFEVDAIAALCGYLPLALRAAGTVLAERVDLDPKDYVRSLKNARMRLELTHPTENLSIEASFGLSYDLLNSELQQKFRMLSVFSGTFDSAGAAAVWSIYAVDAGQNLSTLVRYSMLQFSTTTARYSLHDLIRLFADTRLDPKERVVAGRNHAAYFLRILQKAEALYLSGRQSMKRGLDLFSAELSNIQAGQAWSVSRASQELEAAKLCASYPEAGVHILEFSQAPQDRILWINPGLKAARKVSDSRLELRHMGSLGIAYWRMGVARKAVQLCKESLTVIPKAPDPVGKARVLRCLGLAFQELGRFRRAIVCHKEALKIDGRLDDLRAQISDLNNLGLCYSAVGHRPEAIHSHKQQLALAKKIGDCRGESAALGNLAVVYRKLGNIKKAIEFHKKALVIDLEIGDRTGETGDLCELGKAYAELGLSGRALECYEKALMIVGETGDQVRQGDLLFAMAKELAKTGRLTEAISRAEETLKIFELFKHPRSIEVRKQIVRWRRDA